MVNQELKTTLKRKISTGQFVSADIADYLAIFCQLGNEIEDLQDEVENWDQTLQLMMDGFDPHWLAIQGGQFTTGAGQIETPSLTLSMSVDEAIKIFSGVNDAKESYIAGTLKVQGNLIDAAKVQSLIEIVVEEIEL